LDILTKPWEICQECDEPLASAIHDVVLHELNKGRTAVNMVVDKASKLGIDVDKMKFDSFLYG